MDYSYLFNNSHEIKPVPSIEYYSNGLIDDLKKMKIYKAEATIHNELMRMKEWKNLHNNGLGVYKINFKKLLEKNECYEMLPLLLDSIIYDFDYWSELEKNFFDYNIEWEQKDVNSFYALNGQHALAYEYNIRYWKCVDLHSVIITKPETFIDGISDLNKLINTFSSEFSKNAKYSEKAIRVYLDEWIQKKGFNEQRARALKVAHIRCNELKSISDGTLINWESKWKEFYKSRTAN